MYYSFFFQFIQTKLTLFRWIFSTRYIHKVFKVSKLCFFFTDPPRIQIEKYIVNSDHHSDTELTCTVHAYPLPTIEWRKGDETIEKNNKTDFSLKKIGSHYENKLVIHNLTEKDFGKYVCLANNNLGKNEKTVMLVKTPAIRDFLKPDKSNIVLAWKVDSKSPILEHELQLKKKGVRTS